MKKIGYGVLGLGIGIAHIEAVMESENAELIAICDINKDRLGSASKMCPDARAYSTFDELIADKDVDIISICLPSGMHAEYAIRAMEAGKHVLIEKPVDVTCEKALEIEKVAARTKMKVGVVHQNRYNLNMYPIREALNDGKLGKVFLGTFAVKWYREQNYYDAGSWRGTWELDGGGSLINQSIHTVDIMQWLMGDVDSVSSTMKVYNHDIETEDFTASVISFKSGATATFVSTTCAYPGISTEIMLYGTEGSIECDGDRIRAWKFKGEDGEPDEELEEKMLARYGRGNMKASREEPDTLWGHRYCVEDMILAVRDDREPSISVREATKSLRIIEAIYESAKTGKTVKI